MTAPSVSSASDISAHEIALRLSDRMDELAVHVLGRPNETLSTSKQLRYGKKGSLAIEIDGEKAGTWYDHEQGCGGGALELITRQYGLKNGDAFDWARDWLGLPAYEKGRKRKAEQTPQQMPTHAQAPEQSSPVETANPPAGELTPEERAAKVAAIVADCCDTIEGTPAEFYLRRRGITATPPDCIRFRPRACGGFGALVALATDMDGAVLAIQQIYLTHDGKKAPVEIGKRTNKAVDGWAAKAAVRFPGTPPVILAEGVETALSIWQATGQETWACLGISNIARAPLPEKSGVIVARDGDTPGSKADNQIALAVARLKARGHAVALASPPEGKDFNDILIEGGEDAVRPAIVGVAFQAIGEDSYSGRHITIGSDVEIAKRVREDLIEQYGPVVHAEGQIWRYGQTHWEPIPEHQLRLATHVYDGSIYYTPKGEPSCVKLSKSRVDSALHELGVLTEQPDFFADAPTGINCASGFIEYKYGIPSLVPHKREHRCRHTLPGCWSKDACAIASLDTLLYKLLDGTFKNDNDKEDKQKLLAELFGAAALGHATKLRQPKAAVFKGECAENGKSQLLDLGRGLLPSTAICSLSAARMSDERHIVGLAGKLLNASDELSSSAAITSDVFKAIVTGEPVEGRDVYKSRVEFRSVAQNIFATNTLSPFQGGMDRGVQRRLLVLTFNRVIPVSERIEGIGRRIATEEADLLLAWVVEGATRLMRQRDFTIPASCRQALADWVLGADPVLAWLAECVEIMPVYNGAPSMTTRAAYERFHNWAVAEGFKNDKLPAINGFVQRVQANAAGIEHKRTKYGRVFLGLTLKSVSSLSATQDYESGGDAWVTQ